MTTPVPDPESRELPRLQILTLAELFERRTPPRGRVALHLDEAEWARMMGDVPISRVQPRPGTIGITPVPMPDGGILAFLRCLSGDPDRACFPVIRNVPGSGVVFGPCRCVRGPRGPLEPPQSCSMRIDPASGRLQCASVGCGGRCVPVRLGGRFGVVVTCLCRRT